MQSLLHMPISLIVAAVTCVSVQKHAEPVNTSGQQVQWPCACMEAGCSALYRHIQRHSQNLCKHYSKAQHKPLWRLALTLVYTLNCH